jgi:uncharacterized membrane protein
MVQDGRPILDIGVGVLWAIGWSMVFLSCLVFLPPWAVGTIGIAIVTLHNFTDSLMAQGSFGWIWAILHSAERCNPVANIYFQSGYALLPWMGVIAAGYGFGTLLLQSPAKRRSALLALGLGLTVAFIALRWSNIYGDRGPWSQQPEPLFTLFSFLNCWKYPPSLLYLLMTLGPAITFLGIFDRASGPVSRFFIVFGRVPLFYYLLHLPLIHALAIEWDYYRFGWSPLAGHSCFEIRIENVPKDYGTNLAVVYGVWIGVVLVLYPLCRWFAAFKQRHRTAWLSYL